MSARLNEEPGCRPGEGSRNGSKPVEDLHAVGAETAAISRRRMIAQTAVLAAGLASLSSQQAQAAKAVKPERAPLRAGDRFMIVKGAHKDALLRPEMLKAEAPPFEGFPFDPVDEVLRRKNRLNRVLLLRLDPAEMDEETRARSTDGVLVFSAVCTHRSCTIKSWKAEERHLRCHCHLSEFAALSGGSVKSGPARRQLPMVPLGLDDDGYVVALDGFTRKPGGAKK